MSNPSIKHEYRFCCPLPNGLHARPASRFEQAASAFGSRVRLENTSNRRVANAQSILSLISADIRQGDECILTVDGDDCDAAYQEIVRFVRDELPGCDDALPEPPDVRGEAYIPPVLRAAGVRLLSGKAIVKGFGRGRAVFGTSASYPEEIDEAEGIDAASELKKADESMGQLRRDMTLKLNAGKIAGVESAILRAHLSIVNDVELIEKIHTFIEQEGLTAGRAMLDAFTHFSEILGQAQSELIRERAADLRDVCSQLLGRIYGTAAMEPVELTEPSVCVADTLTPSQFMNLDKRLLRGLVLGQAGSTSHVAILARSFGVPVLTGIRDVCRSVQEGQEVIVDAHYGLLVVEMNPQVERFYAAEQRKSEFMQQRLAVFREKGAQTQDGKKLEITANAATATEVEAAMANGAEGIGLFRTEILFMGRDSAPTEQEQFEEYKKAAACAGSKPVVIRTFDIGGDKNVDYLHGTPEENPVLGYRGVRVYRQHEDLLRDQLRAILRASAFGSLKIMIPMVSCVEEVLYVRGVLEKVKVELDAAGISYDKNISLGIMAEVPSAAFLIPQLAEHIAFISIGTNDLTQYFLAVDRGNDDVNLLYQSRHPGLLGLIQKIIDDAHQHGLCVGMCGEMAGQLENLPLLLGTGIDELSVSIPSVTSIKAACAEYDSEACGDLLKEAVKAPTAAQVDAIAAEFENRRWSRPVIDASLVDLDADCINKEEVIKSVTDMLYLNQRTRHCEALEKDFWQRESIYSTGLGHGFAVPHCKTSHIRDDSICVIRLRQPVEWHSIDDQPVRTIVAMTIRDSKNAGELHMRIFSKLARSIMHKNFRQRLETLGQREEIVEYIQKQLELD